MYLSCLLALHDIFHTPVAQCSLFVLKVLLKCMINVAFGLWLLYEIKPSSRIMSAAGKRGYWRQRADERLDDPLPR